MSGIVRNPLVTRTASSLFRPRWVPSGLFSEVFSCAMFILQGHRGARGLRPENSLAGFQLAVELGITSIETDLHVSADGEFVLCHDPILADGRRICDLTRPQLEALELPRLVQLLELTKNSRLLLDLEIKTVPYRPEYTRLTPEGYAQTLLKILRQHDVVERITIRSFDHRYVQWLRRLEPGLTGAVLISGTAPVNPLQLVQAADAHIYAPDFEFVDRELIGLLQSAKIRVIPWTVNDPEDWRRLLEWGVDGVTTDYPDRLAELLRAKGIAF